MKDNIMDFLRKNVMLVLFVFAVIVVIFSVPGFASYGNMIGIFNQICIYGVVALGMAIAIMAGEWDMSVGSVLALSTIVVASISHYFGSVFLGVAAGILVGSLVGFINGFIIVKGGVNTFITTLATLLAVKGVALTICEVLDKPSAILFNSEFLYAFGNKGIWGIPYLVIFFIVLVFFVNFVLKSTVFGRKVYAIGGNVDVAKISGINVNFNKILIFVIVGTSAGLAGVMMAAKMQCGTPTYALDLPLIAVCTNVLGGNSLSGGRGSAFRTLLGLLILSLITNVFNLVGLNPYYQNLTQGLIIIFTVVIDGYIRGLKTR